MAINTLLRRLRIHAPQIPPCLAHPLLAPIRTRGTLIVLPAKQRVRLIRQDLTQHDRLVPGQLASLLKHVVAGHCDDAPARVVVVLDSGAVDVLLEARPADCRGAHGAGLCVCVCDEC
jgi:hypothetical protein